MDRSEYAVLDIPEYWIVDPFADRPPCGIDSKVTVCEIEDGAYTDVIFVGEIVIVSPIILNSVDPKVGGYDLTLIL